MRLDFKSLAFGYNVQNSTATPAWETSLGQGKGYKINDKPTINELVKGLIYKAVPPKSISFIKGKTKINVKGDDNDSGVVIASVFDKVFINETEIINGKFILLIVKDDAESHKGRLKLKYGRDNRYTINGESICNDDFYKIMRKQLNLAEDACWFVTDMSVVEQDQLIMKTTILNPNGSEEYIDSSDMHAAWDEYYDDDTEIDLYADVKIGDNIIFYGVPGSGKSRKIKDEYCDDEKYMERVVFHPDYTYSDFVGQILPDNNGGHISYPFVPGPFTRILKKAENDKRHNYYLVIEELNRGNAPAIFGEVFQLLDRVDGVSEYGISNADIAFEVYGDKNVQVKIPKNLFILATMNTADQNVFTLDTAFKRRWRMRSVVSDISKCGFAKDCICGSTITWKCFLDTVNPLIIEQSVRNLGSEDKRLGAYFVKMQELASKEYFSEKVLMYLWNDAFKYDHKDIFDEKYKTLDDLIDGFKKIGFKVFANDVKFQTLIDAANSVAEKKEESNNEE